MIDSVIPGAPEDTRPSSCVFVALAVCLTASCSIGNLNPRVVAPRGTEAIRADGTRAVEFVAEHASESAAPVTPNAKEAPQAWFATKLGWKPFELVGFSGQEELGRSYRFSASVFVTGAAIEEAALLGTLATVGIRTPSGMNYFSGYITRIETRAGREGEPHSEGPQQSGRTLEVALVPWTDLLSKRADCAIFAEHDVPSVLRRFLDQRPFAAYRMALERSYPQVPYFVQYRETDSNFMQRLVEHVGIATYFEHGPNGHKLVFADQAAAAEANTQDIALDATRGPRVQRTLELRADRYVVRASELGVSAAYVEGAGGRRSNAPAGLEIYDFEATAQNQSEATFYGVLRAEEHRSKALRVQVYAEGRLVRAGSLVKFTHDTHGLGGSYRVFSANIAAMAGEGELVLDTSFEASPAAVPFRPERTTPWPIISGPQVALVVESSARDPSRVKLRFPWARGEPGSNDLWVPVARASGGLSAALPAPGSEVLVEFLEGEPSRPVVVAVILSARPP